MRLFLSGGTSPLVGVGKTAHTRHNAENVVVSGEYLDYTAGKRCIGRCTTRERKLELSVVNARKVACA
jgi:hypothetical protein